MSAAEAPRSSLDPRELAQFERLGADWWSERGPMRPLHRLNPVRVRWMRDAMIEHFAAPDGTERDPDSLRSLAGLSILDVGCGGGILAEPFARLGAHVTGIDPAPGNIDIARAHAEETGAEVTYRAVSAEGLALEGARFDVVCAMEVVEHVVDPAAFVATVCSLVKPGGLFFTATLNRTLKSFALAIVGAEYVLRWVPPGTHQWEKFVTPDELESWIDAAGLEVFALTGVSYNPLRDIWGTTRNLDVNYMMVARRLMQVA